MTQMSDPTLPRPDSRPRNAPLLRHLPLVAILIVAVIGAVAFRDVLSFETLRDNREALLAYRDAHVLWLALGFVALYIVTCRPVIIVQKRAVVVKKVVEPLDVICGNPHAASFP